jgi:hypothetical protein
MLGKFLTIATLAALSVLAAATPANAYSASQAEAMTDPSHRDPYTFPNVKPCCGAKPDPCANGRCRVVTPRPKPCWERASGCSRPVRRTKPRPAWRCRGEDCDDRPVYRETLHVRCDGGGDTRTLQEAINMVQDGEGQIYVYGGFPGGTCRENLRITGSVTLIGVGEGPNRQRPDLETPAGPCITVSGSRARARIVDMNITSAGGPSCIEVNGGTLRLEGVNVNASAAGAAVVVRSGWFSAVPSGSARTWIIGGGAAVMAQASDIVVGGSILQTAGAFAYTPFSALPPHGGYAPYQPGYPPLRFIDDPDAPYGGGRMPEANQWPGSPAPVTYPQPAPQPVNTWPQGAPAPSYPQPVYPQPVYTGPAYAPPPVNAYAPAPMLNPQPAPFAGTPALVLDESQGIIRESEIRGGSIGIAAVISSSRTGRDVRVTNSRIRSEAGATGILAVASGGWSGMPSRLIVDQNTEIEGFDVGIDLYRTGVALNQFGVKAGSTGIRADGFAYGTITAPRVAASGRCFRFEGDGFSADRSGKLSVSYASCTD